MAPKKIKFAKLEQRMVYSKAYQDLNAPTLKMLSYLLLQLRWINTARTKNKPKYVLTNKGEIEMLYDTPHTDELEGAARMIESWIIEIGRENETKHRG